MMKALVAAVLAAGTLLTVAGCGTPAGDLTVTQSSTVAPTAGATYAWKPVESVAERGGDPRISNDIIQQRIITAVDTALSNKGYRRVSDPGQATLLVSYFIGLRTQSDARPTYDGPIGPGACGFSGCVSGWGVYGYPTMDIATLTYTEGTVILDLVDRPSNDLAWRAVSRQRVDSGDVNQDRLNAIFADMVKSLPGRPAGGAR